MRSDGHAIIAGKEEGRKEQLLVACLGCREIGGIAGSWGWGGEGRDAMVLLLAEPSPSPPFLPEC